MTKKQLWESKLAQRGKHLKEAYDDFASAVMSDGTKVYASASTRSTRTYNYEDVEFEFGARKGHGTYRWMNRPWQRFIFADALKNAMIDAGVDKEFARECIDKNGSLRSAVEYFAKNYKIDKKEIGESCKEGCELKEEPTYDLGTEYDARKSFYGKAKVDVRPDGSQVLYSYGSPVCQIKDGKAYLLRHVNGYASYASSQTTLRHVKEFLKQNGFKADSLKQMEKDYPVQENSFVEAKNEGLEASKGKVLVEQPEEAEEVEEKENKLKVGSFEFCVMDKYGNNIDCFEVEEDAIMFAKKKSNADRVLLVKYGPEDEYKDRPELSAETIWSVNDNEDDDEIVKEEVEENKTYQIQYWLSEEDREEGFSDILMDTFETKEEAIQVARKMIDRDNMAAAVEVFNASTDELVFGYDGVKTWGSKDKTKIKEDIDNKYVIYKEGNKFKGTSKSNYDARIQDAHKIQDFSDFKSVAEIETHLKKYSKTPIEIVDLTDPLKEARGPGKGQKLDKFFRLVVDLYKDNLSKEEIAKLEKAKAEVERFEPTSEYEKKDKKNLLQQIERALKDASEL